MNKEVMARRLNAGGRSTDKIAVIKVGWSDDYQGGPVEAAHKHVKKHKDGHEKFNFLPGPDGRFYVYAPPVSGYQVAPKPRRSDGWLIFQVAKSPSRPGLYLTGWYEGANFEGGYVPRPEYNSKRPSLPLDDLGETFFYTLSADTAVQVFPNETPFIFPGDHMKRSPIYYLRGNGKKEAWCEELVTKLLTIRRDVGNRTVQRAPLSSSSGGGICADPERRKEVEEAAIKAVCAHFPKSQFEIHDRQMEKCGFDLLVRSKADARDELHVEVKGTQNKSAHFLMSHREYAYMLGNPRHWRLAMVTDALGKVPNVEIMGANEAQARFFWKEFTWHATARKA